MNVFLILDFLCTKVKIRLFYKKSKSKFIFYNIIFTKEFFMTLFFNDREEENENCCECECSDDDNDSVDEYTDDSDEDADKEEDE